MRCNHILNPESSISSRALPNFRSRYTPYTRLMWMLPHWVRLLPCCAPPQSADNRSSVNLGGDVRAFAILLSLRAHIGAGDVNLHR